MALFDKFRKNKVVSQDNEVIKSTGNNASSFGNWTTVTPGVTQTFEWQGRQIRLQGFEKNPVVMACIRTITDIVSAIKLEVYKENQKGDQKVLDTHPLLDILNNPIKRMNGQQLLGITCAHILTYGNAYWFLDRNGSRINQIVIVYPESMNTIYVDALTGEPATYYWTDRLGRQHVTQADDMVHFRDLPSNNSVVGYPRAAAAMAEILADNTASEYINQFFQNNGIPGSIISIKNATNQDLKAAELSWNDKFVSKGKRGLPAFVNGDDVKVEAMAFNAQQLEAPEMRKISRESICAVFGIDPRMISIGSAATDGGLSGNQYTEARFRLIQQTCIPLMTLIASCINDVITPEYGFVYIRFSPDNISEISEDTDTTSKRVLAEWEGGLRGLKEARKALKLSETLDPDDILISQIVRPGRPKLPMGETGDTGLIGGNEPDALNGTKLLGGSPQAQAALPPGPSTTEQK